MTREITNEQLWILEMDIQKVSKDYPSIAFFLDLKFKVFMKETEFLRRILHTEVKKIQLRFIEHEIVDDKEVPVYTDNTMTKWKFKDTAVTKDGVVLAGAEVEEFYNREFNEFIKRSVTVRI